LRPRGSVRKPDQQHVDDWHGRRVLTAANPEARPLIVRADAIA
jgi:hypothetical protein